ncbi:hypothetical protein F5B19DRAFT_358500 [Rostrohypoxylon terebratum]|nr:hypothetical protein F5B19DRAFT_358500 [Rostrohypoxylon terebratum]
MAIYWLLSFVCLLASTTIAQDYSRADILDAVATKSITETVTKYLAQCGVTLTPFELPDTTLSGTTTVTSTLQATVSVTVANTHNTPDYSTIWLATQSPNISFTPFSSYSAAGTGGYPYPLANTSTPPANTTKIPCFTATVSITTSSSTPASHSITSSHATSSSAAASVSPTQVPISGSTKLGYEPIMQNVAGLLGITFMLTVGLTVGFL